jgi:hypothetical protein
VKLFVQNEKRKKIAGNYKELKREALVALCEAVGIEIEQLKELEQRGLIRRNTEHMRSLSTEGISVNGMVTNINPMSGEIVGGKSHSATIDSTGATTLPDSPTRDQGGVELNRKNQRRRSEMQEQMRPYANRDSTKRLSGVGGTKNKCKKKALFAIDSSDRDQKWAPSATIKQSTQEQSAEAEITAPPADGRSSKQDALASGSKLCKARGGAADIPTIYTPEQGAGKAFAAEDNQATSTAEAVGKTHNQRADI